jgi:hypothetical protein
MGQLLSPALLVERILDHGVLLVDLLHVFADFVDHLVCEFLVSRLDLLVLVFESPLELVVALNYLAVQVTYLLVAINKLLQSGCQLLGRLLVCQDNLDDFFVFFFDVFAH